MQNFNVDISAPGGPLVFYAMQADSLSRFFTLTITDGGEAWEPPDGALWSVRFGAPQMPSGWYDTVEDATDATHPAVNVATGVATVATVEIAEQALESPGQNILCVLVTDSSGYQIASWPIILSIQAVPGLTAPEVTDYYNLLTGQVAQTLQNAQAAAASATLAESWAVGGTGSRTGEDTNNSEYWAQQAAESAQEAVGFRTFQGGSVLPINGDADLTQPLPTKTAESVSITSNKNRIAGVTVHGFTTQDGSGDPSPSNMREIKNAGLLTKHIVIDGNSTIVLSPEATIIGTSRRANITISDGLKYTHDQLAAILSSYLPTKTAASVSDTEGLAIGMQYDFNAQRNAICFRVPGCLTIEDYKLWFTNHPLDVAYISTEDTGKHYTGIGVTQGEDYHCTIVEINDRLHEGDTLETNAESGFDAELLANGSEAWSASAVSGTYYLVMRTRGGIISDVLPQSDWLPSAELNDLYNGKVCVSTADNSTLRLRLPENADPKTYLPTHPLRIFYKSASGGTPLNVKRETHLKATLEFTGTEDFRLNASGTYPYFSLISGAIFNAILSGTCSHFPVVSISANNNNQGVGGYGGAIYVRWPGIDTVEQLKELLSQQYAVGTPVTLEYELAEPEVYADTPVSVENPKGAYTVSGEDGTTVQAFISVQPTPENIGALSASGTAQAATKLASSVNIGSASFDGSQSITLAQMGAAAAAQNISALTQNAATYGNGMIVEWGSVQVTDLQCTTVSGGLYTGAAAGAIFQSNFTTPPLVLATFVGSVNYAFACPVNVTTDGIGGFTVSRGMAATISGTIVFLAIGM